MEQATKGQIGQPAACMIENKGEFSAQCECLSSGRLSCTPVLVGKRRDVVGENSQKLWITLCKTGPPVAAEPRRCFIVTHR
jgi:hypothetical protein